MSPPVPVLGTLGDAFFLNADDAINFMIILNYQMFLFSAPAVKVWSVYLEDVRFLCEQFRFRYYFQGTLTYHVCLCG